MWFWLSLIALLCWSGSDLFSKIGCQGEDDHLAHLKGRQHGVQAADVVGVGVGGDDVVQFSVDVGGDGGHDVFPGAVGAAVDQHFGLAAVKEGGVALAHD